MSEENKNVVRRLFTEVSNAGRMDRADAFVTADCVEHQQLPGAEGRQGIKVAKAFLSMMRGAFPDYRYDIEDRIAEGDKVGARLTVSGTQRGELLSLIPTSKRIRTSGIEVFRLGLPPWSSALVFRLAGGNLAEHWATFDALGCCDSSACDPYLALRC